MAHIDAESGEIVVRVLYDGPPGAGKTTSLRLLHATLLSARSGALVTPDEHERARATEYFDWREFDGGYLGDHRVRCQVVSVPGQRSRWDRRALLLRDADAVVLVVAADPASLREARGLCDRLRDDPERALLVQLNKIDLADAVTSTSAREVLGLDPDTPLLETSASDGRGVSAVMLRAMRAVSARLRDGAHLLPRRRTPSMAEILAAMHASRRERAGRASDAPWHTMWPMTRLLDVDLRAVFAQATHAQEARTRDDVWTTDRWELRSSDDDVFETEASARAALAARARHAPAVSYVLADEGPFVRLWTLAPRGEGPRAS